MLRSELPARGLLAAFTLLGLSAPALAGAAPEPADFRMEDYRSPTPPTLKGATVVTTAQAAALWQNKAALFVDVMPFTPKPANLPKGTIWRDPVRQDIPESLWLANVGYGALPKETEAYLSAALASHAGSKQSPILFYCMTDCWMSWNAAKRAMQLGYTNVIWYPAGADGWKRAGLPVVENKPLAMD